MSQSLVQEVTDLIEEKIEKRETFSIYKDITVELRKDGAIARNGDVRLVVHSMFGRGDMGDYDRTLISVPGQRHSIFLYHPPGADISQYDPSLAPSKKPSHAPLSMANAYATDNAVIAVGVYRQTGKEGYLYIPKSMIESVGLKIGDTAYVYENAGGLAITRSEDDAEQPEFDGNLLAQYKVDMRGNVRIPQHHLPHNNGKYRIVEETGQNHILVL